MNIWNELVEIKNRFSSRTSGNEDTNKKNMIIVNHADMLLKQYGTAGGKEIMGNECINFILKHKKNGNQKETPK